MRITIVQGAFFPIPPLKGGAVEKVWFALGKQFAHLGHEVTHISRCYDKLPSEEEIDGVKHLRVRGFDQPQSTILLKVCDLIYSLRALQVLPAADVLVTNTFWLPLLARNPKYGAIYVHVARYPKGQMLFYRRAARLQAVSKTVAAAIVEQAPVLAGKVRNIPNPLPDASPDQIAPIEARPKLILYAGRIHPEKGLEILLDAFLQLSAYHDDWRMSMVGPWETDLGGGGPEYLAQLKARAATEKIDWVGMVSDPISLRTRYQAARLFVYPSLAERGEALPLAPVEAMANGCAVIVSSLRCFTEYLKDNVTGLVFDYRAKDPVTELAKKMSLVMDDEGLMSRIAACGTEKAREYSVEKVAMLYLNDFQSIL